jgi:hypothetical protein
MIRHRRAVALRPLFAACLIAQVLAPAAWAQVVVPPIAPPKPAVERNPNALVIGTGDLNEALNWARQGNLSEATTSFHLFRDDWQSVSDEVRAQSDEVADGVDTAVAAVEGLVTAPQAPDQGTYFPVFQSLANTVEDANAQLNALAPAIGTLRIAPTDLGQSVTWASQGNLAKAHDEFDQFRDDWSLVQVAVRQAAPPIADGIDQATAKVTAIISNPNNTNPPQSEYYPALQALQQTVLDANKQLALLGAPEAAPEAGVPVTIKAGNLGQSVTAAGAGDLANAKKEYGEFQDDWSAVKDAVRARSGAMADRIEAANTKAGNELKEDPPTQSQYFEALQTLQQAVLDANAQLGN